MVGTSKFQEKASEIEKRLLGKDETREELLKLSRAVIKYAGQSIEGFHRNKKDQAQEKLKLAKEAIAQINEHLTVDQKVYNLGIVGVAMQEYAEAQLLSDLIADKNLSTVEELNITDQAYLLGIADLIGELRRYILEKLVEGNLKQAKNLYNIMKELYGTYLQIEFGKNLIPDLRRKKDTARVLIERTLSDLFVAQQSSSLEKKLDEQNRN